MKITIIIEDSAPWYAPFRTPREYLDWQKEQDEYEQRRINKRQRWKEATETFDPDLFGSGWRIIA